jgi:hypothetical protein
MSTFVIFFGWNRSVPGREQQSAAHFPEFLQYLAGLQGQGAIDSFEPVMLTAHGGDMNGFVLIRGENEQLDALVATEQWQEHITRAGYHMEGAGSIRGVTGEGVMEWMSLWGKVIVS